jgi:hypothetical protein
MTNGPPIFAYLVFGLGRVSLERLLRPIKAGMTNEHGLGSVRDTRKNSKQNRSYSGREME